MNNDKTRVLARLGARELATEEIEIVAGARATHTLVCTLVKVGTTTGSGDGDGCQDFD